MNGKKRYVVDKRRYSINTKKQTRKSHPSEGSTVRGAGRKARLTDYFLSSL